MRKELRVVLRSTDSSESFQTVSQVYDQKAPEVEILVVDGQENGTSFQVMVAYEGGEAFSIRSPVGSRIMIRGGKVNNIFIP